MHAEVGTKKKSAEQVKRRWKGSGLLILLTRQKSEQENSKNAEFQVFNCYLPVGHGDDGFQRAVRTGDWKLHLTSLEMFTKYFFAYDRLHYARIIPLYLAEMKMLKESDPEMHREFVAGNWVVNKTPMCHSVDLEQIMP